MTTNAAAAIFVRPFNDLVGEWQAASVKLHAVVHRSPQAETADQIEALVRAVGSAQEVFEAAVAEQAPEVVRHSRINDNPAFLPDGA